jgi:phage shock protein C
MTLNAKRPMSNQRNNDSIIGGLILIILGIIFSFKTFWDINLFSYIKYIWPLGLVALGVYIILKNNDKNQNSGGGFDNDTSTRF